MSVLQSLFKGIEDGAVWVDGGWLKKLGAALEADRARLMPTSGSEIPTDTGRWFDIRASGGGSSGPRPFALLNASDEDGKKIRVVYGTVNGQEPDGMSPGDTPKYIVDTVGAAGYVYLVVTADPLALYTITSVSIDVGATVPADTDDTFYLQLGSYAVDGETLSIAQSVGGSLSFKWCDGPLFALS